jgi:aminoglycoside N3'-acetyltransferase
MNKIKKIQLQNHLEHEVGIVSEDSVFLFSDLRGLGDMENAADGVLEVFEEILKHGNLVIPTFSYSWNDGKLFKADEKNAPLMGSIAQTSILRKGYTRTFHPNFSVNIWSNQQDFLSKTMPTSNDSFGEGSVLNNIYENFPNCKIVLLGGAFSDSIFRNTFIHTAQQKSNVWYRYLKNITNPLLPDQFVTQLVRFQSIEEFEIQRNSKFPDYLNFPIKENYDKLGQELLTTRKLKIFEFAYAHTKIATVSDTINTFMNLYANNNDFGLQYGT